MYAIRLLRFRKAIVQLRRKMYRELHPPQNDQIATSNTARHFKITHCELNYEFNLVIYIIFNSVRISSQL